MSTSGARRQRRRKIMALAAGGVAVGVATMATLASWTDSEWVFGGGGADGLGGVGTSVFEVQQNRDTTPPLATAVFDDRETNVAAGELMFSVDPNALTPGDSIYAPVALRTTADSISGTVQLQQTVTSANTAHVADDTGGLLWSNLLYSVRVTSDSAVAANCNSTAFASAGTEIVGSTGLDSAISPGAQVLSAAAGNVQYYCFQVSLPDNPTTQTLGGRTVYPAWEFAATSD